MLRSAFTVLTLPQRPGGRLVAGRHPTLGPSGGSSGAGGPAAGPASHLRTVHSLILERHTSAVQPRLRQHNRRRNLLRFCGRRRPGQQGRVADELGHVADELGRRRRRRGLVHLLRLLGERLDQLGAERAHVVRQAGVAAGGARQSAVHADRRLLYRLHRQVVDGRPLLADRGQAQPRAAVHGGARPHRVVHRVGHGRRAAPAGCARPARQRYVRRPWPRRQRVTSRRQRVALARRAGGQRRLQTGLPAGPRQVQQVRVVAAAVLRVGQTAAPRPGHRRRCSGRRRLGGVTHDAAARLAEVGRRPQTLQLHVRLPLRLRQLLVAAAVGRLVAHRHDRVGRDGGLLVGLAAAAAAAAAADEQQHQQQRSGAGQHADQHRAAQHAALAAGRRRHRRAEHQRHVVLHHAARVGADAQVLTGVLLADARHRQVRPPVHVALLVDDVEPVGAGRGRVVTKDAASAQHPLCIGRRVTGDLTSQSNVLTDVGHHGRLGDGDLRPAGKVLRLSRLPVLADESLGLDTSGALLVQSVLHQPVTEQAQVAVAAPRVAAQRQRVQLGQRLEDNGVQHC